MELDDGIEELVGVGDVLDTVRYGQAGFAKDFASDRLRPDLRQLRIRGVEGQRETNGERSLQVGRVETGHVSGGRVGDRRANLLHDVRPVEDLPGQGREARVLTRHHLEAAPGVGGGDPWEQMQVVVDDRRIDAPARHIHHLGPGQLQQHEEAEHALLVVQHPVDLGELGRVEAHRRNDHHGPRSLRIGEHLSVHRRKRALETVEPLDLQEIEAGRPVHEWQRVKHDGRSWPRSHDPSSRSISGPESIDQRSTRDRWETHRGLHPPGPRR